MKYFILEIAKQHIEVGDYVEIYGGIAGPKMFSGQVIEKYGNAFVLQEYRRVEDGTFILGPARSYEFSDLKYTAQIFKPLQWNKKLLPSSQ